MIDDISHLFSRIKIALFWFIFPWKLFFKVFSIDSDNGLAMNIRQDSIFTNDDVMSYLPVPLQWRHTGRYGVSNHQPHGCLLNRLFGHRSKKTSKLRVTGLCVGN